MDTYKETFETWNKVAQLYQDKFMDLDLYNDTYDQFCEQLPTINSAILEIGCGPGNITKYLLNKRPDFKICGVDISPNMIALTKTNNPNADFKVMDSREINTLQAKFDAIICGFCLPYLSAADVEKMIKDSNNLLEDKGVLYLSFVEGDKGPSYQTGSSGDRTYFYYHKLENLTNALNANDFEIINLVCKDYNKSNETEVHTIIIARKKTNT